MEFKTAIHIPGNQLFTDHVLQCVKDAGFDAVALGFYADGARYLRENNWRDAVLRIREKLEEYGLPCVQTHLPCYEIRRSSDEPCEEEAVLIERGIEATAMLGCRWGAWHPRTDFNHGFDRKNGIRDNVRELRRFVKTAEKFDVGVAVENLPVFPDCRNILFFSSRYEDLIEVVDTLDSSHVGITWDTGHAHLMRNLFSQGDAIRAAGSRIKILHLNNNFGNADVHTPLAIGGIDWHEVMGALSDIGFDGCWTTELSTPYDVPELLRSIMIHHGESARWLKNFLPR